MQIISIANQKGGVAKTTSTLNIGKCLEMRGKKTLLIDLDSQASLTIAAGFEPYDYDESIVTVMTNEKVDTESCIVKMPNGVPDIITSKLDLAKAEMDLINRALRETVLKRALAKIDGMYDYVLIDCPPQLGMLTINALACSNWVLIPAETAYLSYRGVESLIESVSDIKELINPDLEILGLIATRFDSRIKDASQVRQALNQKYDVLGTVKELSAAKVGIYQGLKDYDVTTGGKNPIAQAYRFVTDVIIDRIERKGGKKNG